MNPNDFLVGIIKKRLEAGGLRVEVGDITSQTKSYRALDLNKFCEHCIDENLGDVVLCGAEEFVAYNESKCKIETSYVVRFYRKKHEQVTD